ncbi:hypothetical protein AX16_008407 [Volvariella volvacea WC 439]|nr:hypothetical protein AX16_008407 [Volvariella volvacea WC 439]
MSAPKLIVVYAGWGDTLLLQVQKSSSDPIKYWLIDGGPVTTGPKTTVNVNGEPGKQGYHAFYQFLRNALLRFCCSGDKNADGSLKIDLLAGIIVTHPDRDHMDGIIQLIADWLPDDPDKTSAQKPLAFKGPVILNKLFFDLRTELSDLLKAKHFKDTDLRDGDIPTELSNWSASCALYKMLYKPPSTRVARMALQVDTSKTNISSIISDWQQQGFSPIVTTGDAIGEHVLDRINNLPSKSLSIFKIPHHGSQYNGQINKTYDITDAQSGKEANIHLFLALAGRYVFPKMTAGNDKDVVGDSIVDITDNRSPDWINLPRAQSSSSPRDNQLFNTSMDELSQLFFSFIRYRKFKYRDGGVTLDLTQPNDLSQFVVLLARRHFGIIESLYANNIPVVDQWRQNDYLSKVSPKFQVDQFNHPNFIPYEPRNPAQPKAIARLNINYVDLITCVHSDPGNLLQYQMGNKTFYDRFSAVNYIISANGLHETGSNYGHPHPSLVAGVMLAAIARNSGTSRLFVTDGHALQIDVIRTIVKDIIAHGFPANHKPAVADWNKYIRVFYLDSDYCAAIPVDLSDVAGVTEVRFDAQDDAVDARRILHKELNRTAAYDLPRAAEPDTSSFALYVNKVEAANRIAYDENTSIFSAGGATPFRFSLKRKGSATGNDPLNVSSYNFYARSTAGTNAPILFPVPVIFEEKTSSSWTGVKFEMLNEAGTEVLAYVTGSTTQFNMQPVGTPGLERVQIQFVREEGLGAQPQSASPSLTSLTASAPTLTRVRRSVLDSTASMLGESEISESFESWWKRMGPANPPPVITLADVLQVALGSVHTLFTIPPAPFLFADVQKFAVDVGGSPPVISRPDGSFVVNVLLKLNSSIVFSDIAGLGSRPVQSLNAIMSSGAGTLDLNAQLAGTIPVNCVFQFEGRSPAELYLRAIGYTGAVTGSDIALTDFASSITGRGQLYAFLSGLPTSLTTVINLPGWKVDPLKTEISFVKSPFGVDVQSAKLYAAIPTSLTSITVDALKFGVNVIFLTLKRQNEGIFDVTLSASLSLSANSVDIQLQMVASTNRDNTMLDFVVASPSSPLSVLKILGLERSSSLPLPLGDKTVDLSLNLDYVGFRLLQPCSGTTSVLNLDTVYFRISAEWSPWKEVLPTQLAPEEVSKVKVTVVIQKPRTNFAVGLQVDYQLVIDASHSRLDLRMAYWPMKSRSGNSNRLSVSLSTNPTSTLPAPSLSDILNKFTNTSWNDVKEAIPLLGTVTDTISIVDASLDIDNAKRVAGFSITARIQNLTILSQPSLVIEKADVIILYNGSSWSGRLESQILFAGRFNCAVLLSLPCQNTPGALEFRNLSDDFTFGELVKQISSDIDLNTIPIVGGSILSSLRLGYVSIALAYVESKLAITSFGVELTWGNQLIGQLNTFGNRLRVQWQRTPLNNVPSIKGPETTIATGNAWSLQWEGAMSANWHLTATIQYSNIDVENTSHKLLVVSGEILNLAGIVQAQDLVNGWTGSSSGGSVTPSTVWQDTIPKNVTPSFTLRRCATNCVPLGEQAAFGIAAEATWGEKGRGTAVIIVQKSLNTQTGSQWGFTVALGVVGFRFTDLVQDSALAKMIDDAIIKASMNVSILAFYSPQGVKLADVKQTIQNAVNCNILPSSTTMVPLNNVNENLPITFVGGIAVFLDLDFNNAQSGSLTDNLSLVSTSTLPKIQLMGYFGKASDQTTSVIFTASLHSITLFTWVTLTEITLTYQPSISGNNIRNNVFSLSATCTVQFSSTSSWSIQGELVIRESSADFKFLLLQGTLPDLLGLKISNIAFTGRYHFKDSSSEGNDTIVHGNQGVTCDLSLSADAKIGDVKAVVSLVFNASKPAVMLIKSDTKIVLSSLIDSIFGTSTPADILDVTFSNLVMYYCWIATPKAAPDPTTYEVGFHASADVSVYGIGFILSLDISGGTDEKLRGIKIKGAKKTPVEVLCITLTGAVDTTIGPELALSTRPADKGCSVAAGIRLFGTDLGSITLLYDSSVPRFLGTVNIKGFSFLPGGQASISFELVEVNGKNRLRFVGLPALFDNLVQAIQIIEKIKEFSAADGSPCGAVTLAFEQVFPLYPTIADSQGGQAPEEGIPSDHRKVKLEITGRLDIDILGHKVTDISFTPFPVDVDLPKSLTLEAFASSLAKSLGNAAGSIIKGLWDDKEKLMAVIALVAFKKLGAEAIKSLICRDYYKPKPSPGDEPDPDQKPDTGNDGGGADGDIGAGAGGSAVGGSAAAGAAEGLGATLATLAGVLLGLFGALFSPRPTPPSPPRPGPPPEPSADDSFAKAIYDIINKDFNRWTKCDSYKTALDTALECALDYRAAIQVLRKALSSSTTSPNLPGSVYKDYQQRRAMLIYDFSLLSQNFANKWLDFSGLDTMITTTLVEPEDSQATPPNRKLKISWNSPYNDQSLVTSLTVYINDDDETNPVIKLKQFDSNVAIVDIPPFGSSGLRITAKVGALAATWGGDPKYAFYSQGKPAASNFVEQPLKIKVDTLDVKEFTNTLPELTAGPPVDISSVRVLSMESYQYWPMSFKNVQGDVIALVVQDTAKNVAKVWALLGARGIQDITIGMFDVKFVPFTGTPVPMGLSHLLISQDELPRVAQLNYQRDFTKELPNLWPGVTSSTSPVFIMGHLQYWPMSYSDNRMAIVIIAQDKDKKVVKKWNRSGLRYIDKINFVGGKVIFVGQGGTTIEMTVFDLLVDSVIDKLPHVATFDYQSDFTKERPELWPGLLTNNMSVFVMDPYQYWPMSYSDNRMEVALVAQNKDKKVVKTWNLNGIRYIDKITIDGGKVRFTGQGSVSVERNIADLRL